MSKHRVAVLKVVSSQSSVTAAAAEYGISRGHLHRLLRRYREGGLDDLEPTPQPRTGSTSCAGATLRRAGRLYHLKVGAAHARRRVLAIVDEQEVTIVALDTGQILSTHSIEPDKGYWRNTRRDPGRWPGSQATG